MSTFIELTSDVSEAPTLVNIDRAFLMIEVENKTFIAAEKNFYESFKEDLETVKRLIREAEESKCLKFFCTPTIGDDDIVLCSQTLTDSPSMEEKS